MANYSLSHAAEAMDNLLKALDADLDGVITDSTWYITFNGKQAALTFGIADTNAVRIDSATAAAGEYLKLTAAGVETKSVSEMKTDLSFITSTTVLAITALTAAQYAALDPVVATTLYIVTDGQRLYFGTIQLI